MKLRNSVLIGLIFAGSVAACSASTDQPTGVGDVGSLAPPEATAALTVEQRVADGVPVLAAIDKDGWVLATYAHSVDEHAQTVTIALTDERALTGEFRIVSRSDEQTELFTSGDIGHGTWSSAAGSPPPASVTSLVEPWSDLFSDAMADEANANHVVPLTASTEEDRGLVCAGICGVVVASSCKLKTWVGVALCSLVGTVSCESACTSSGSYVCAKWKTGSRTYQTCCQAIYGCRSTCVAGSCPY